MREGWIVIGHGSRDAAGVAEFLELARLLAARRMGRPTAWAFLEFAQPTIDAAIAQLAAQGIKRIVCVPGMLCAAGHVKKDIPREVQAGMQRWPGIDFRTARALDVHPKLLELCGIRWRECLSRLGPAADADTALVVVGRGWSDPHAKADIGKITRLLVERYGVAWGTTCYSGVSAPLVPEALEVASRGGFRRVLVQPYFLFSGVLVKKVEAWTREAARRRPDLEIVCTSHLGVHPLLADVFEERGHEAVHGAPDLNGQLCG